MLMKVIDRPLTEQERAWLIQGLATLPTGKALGGGVWAKYHTGEVDPLGPPVDPEPFLRQIEGLRVVGICDCGEPDCHTVTFQHAAGGKRASLVYSHIEDGRLLIIDLNKDTGLLAQMEII